MTADPHASIAAEIAAGWMAEVDYDAAIAKLEADLAILRRAQLLQRRLMTPPPPVDPPPRRV
jgi:hypothetical protein